MAYCPFLIAAVLVTQLTFADDAAPPAESDRDITTTLLDRIGSLEKRVTELETERTPAEAPGSARTPPSPVPIAAATLQEVRVFRLNLSEPTKSQRVTIRKLVDRLADADESTHADAVEKLRDIGLPAETILEQASRTAQGEFLERIEQIRADIKSPPPIATLEGHEGEVRQVVFSPTGNFLATSTITGDVRLWNPESFQLDHTLTLKLSGSAGGRHRSGPAAQRNGTTR